MDSYPDEYQRSNSLKSNSFKSNYNFLRAYTFNTLFEIGFSREAIRTAILYTDSNDIDELVDFLTKDHQGWNHEFIPNEKGLCEICSENASEHSKYLPHNENRQNKKASIQSINERFSINMPKQEIKSFSRICGICYEETIDLIHISDCKDHLYCKNCIKTYLEILISESNVLKILCPGKTCNVYFTDTLIQSFISPNFISKYYKFLKVKQLLNDPFTKFCPQPDCEGYIQGSKTDAHQFCNVCYYEMCFDCGKGWHEGNTCDEIQEKEYNTWAKDKNVKECPVCKYKIEKNEGCDHMICIICMHEFCWVCLKPKSHDARCECLGYGINQRIHHDGDNIAQEIRIYNALMRNRTKPKRKVTTFMLVLGFLFLPFVIIALLYIPAFNLYIDLTVDQRSCLGKLRVSYFTAFILKIIWVAIAPLISILVLISKLCKYIKNKCFPNLKNNNYHYLEE
ncbi:hypothetical protein SteCoe_11841 [Stentor coeruleus]|uniref:RBR-type E3 ubiquitin transferase n=1 Tax=Stentor coeruleus TaxID=5963 RepID=A0A1R2CCB4_9CILI|nr:hypothetical protein SteCoe_11841 [Stentor coeruleus]